MWTVTSVIVWQIKCQDKQYAQLEHMKWKYPHTGGDLCLATGPFSTQISAENCLYTKR